MPGLIWAMGQAKVLSGVLYDAPVGGSWAKTTPRSSSWGPGINPGASRRAWLQEHRVRHLQRLHRKAASAACTLHLLNHTGDILSLLGRGLHKCNSRSQNKRLKAGGPLKGVGGAGEGGRGRIVPRLKVGSDDFCFTAPSVLRSIWCSAYTCA